MPRFNFTEITGQSRVSIDDIMSNFNKIESLGITSQEVADALSPITQSIQTISTGKQKVITTGTTTPTGGTDGDIYIQYFD